MSITDDQRQALRRLETLCPFAGFPAGSNMYSFVVIAEDTPREVRGADIDRLLRSGLLEAVPRDNVLLTGRSLDQDICPDCECTHDIVVTDDGRKALEGSTDE